MLFLEVSLLLVTLAGTSQAEASRRCNTVKVRSSTQNCPAASQDTHLQIGQHVGSNDRRRHIQKLAAKMLTARQNAVAAAREMLKEEIKEAQKEASETVGIHVMKPETVEAVMLCRQARDPVAIPLLIAAIDFVAPVYEMEGKVVYFASSGEHPAHKLWPARSALVAIGSPCVRALLDALKKEPISQANWSRRYSLLATLGAISGPEGGLRALRDTLAKEREVTVQFTLQKAIEEFKKQGAIILLTESPDLQLYQGTVHEDLSTNRRPTKETDERE